MPMKPLAGLFLAIACLLGVTSTACIFELAYGAPGLGTTVTGLIVALATPCTIWSLVVAIRLNKPA
ncbi:MAG: hypothetical protein AB8E74_00930 [Prochlorococcus sp.]